MEPMPDVTLDATQARVLGCLIEKARTTPDQYPMSLNGVRVACNQVSNRDPIVDYSEAAVERTLRQLSDEGLARMVHRPGDRVVKYRHAADEVFGLSDKEVSLIAVLLLRGPQTPGELRQRTNRYVEFTGLADVESTLEQLRSRGAVVRLERRPGQKEHRYQELLSDRGTGDERVDDTERDAPAPAAPPGTAGELEELRAEIDDLKARFGRLLDALGVDDV
jgi:uncharacterized protein YceH (UPF0502 family)